MAISNVDSFLYARRPQFWLPPLHLLPLEIPPKSNTTILPLPSRSVNLDLGINSLKSQNQLLLPVASQGGLQYAPSSHHSDKQVRVLLLEDGHEQPPRDQAGIVAGGEGGLVALHQNGLRSGGVQLVGLLLAPGVARSGQEEHRDRYGINQAYYSHSLFLRG